MSYHFNNNKFEELTKNINKNINIYKLNIEILEHLQFLKKKDGSDFKDLKKAFNIEGLKDYFKNQGKYKEVYIYLESGEEDYTIKWKIGNFESFISIDYKIYLRRLSKEEKEEAMKTKDIIKVTPCYSSDKEYYYYYLLNTTEEIQEALSVLIKRYEKFLKRELQAMDQLPVLKEITLNFIKECNEKLKNDFDDYRDISFYYSSIRELIS